MPAIWYWTPSKPITASIPRNQVVLFNEQSTKLRDKGCKVSLLKSESNLFSRLYISCQRRDGNIDIFYSHENHPFPPSLSTYGELRLGKKSELMNCIERHVRNTNTKPKAEVVILDGAVLVNMLRPKESRTFGDYASNVFIPYIEKEKK